jgi:hypothetical protein
MVRFRLSFSLVLLALAFAGTAQAQQNLFNVPNGQITRYGEVFFQQQFNWTKPLGTSNTTLDFGLGRGWEVGLNFLDANLYDRTDGGLFDNPKQVNPDLLFNVQKGFEISEFWSIGVGGQFGFNPNPRKNDIRFLNFSWVVNSFEIPEHEEFGKFYLGGYYANGAYRGPGDSGGFLLGYELPIVPEKFSLQADWIGGNNDLSVIVLGGVYTFKSGWQVSLGAQIPTPRSNNEFGVVLELTYPGYKLR